MDDDVRLDGRRGARDDGRPYRRVEVITGDRRRRSWSAEEKARIVAESAAPGANISAVARRNGLNRGLLTVWRREAGVVPPAVMPTFVPITVADEPMPAVRAERRKPFPQAAPGRIEVDLRSGRLLFDGAVDPDLAAAVIAGVRG